MKFFGKQIPTDKINFVMNCVSFVLGLIFFIRMQYKMNEQPAPVNFNSEHDSLIKIETRVSTELKEIKKVQDSIGEIIHKNEILLSQQTKKITGKRQQLYATINSDWDKLPVDEQTAYVNNLMSNLKHKNK